MFKGGVGQILRKKTTQIEIEKKKKECTNRVNQVEMASHLICIYTVCQDVLQVCSVSCIIDVFKRGGIVPACWLL